MFIVSSYVNLIQLINFTSVHLASLCVCIASYVWPLTGSHQRVINSVAAFRMGKMSQPNTAAFMEGRLEQVKVKLGPYAKLEHGHSVTVVMSYCPWSR